MILQTGGVLRFTGAPRAGGDHQRSDRWLPPMDPSDVPDNTVEAKADSGEWQPENRGSPSVGALSGEQIARSVQQLPLSLAHLDRVNRVIGGGLLDGPAAIDRFHGDHGLQLGAVGAALADRWEPLSGAVSRLRGNDVARPCHYHAKVSRRKRRSQH
jgi:hypothetical protein